MTRHYKELPYFTCLNLPHIFLLIFHHLFVLHYIFCPKTFYCLETKFILLLGQIDSNTDGLVDFSEFVAAALHVRQLEEHDSERWHSRSQAAFEKFDVDKDGYITPEELRMVILFMFAKFIIPVYFSSVQLLWTLLNSYSIFISWFFLFLLQHTGLRGSIEPLLDEADIDKDGRISLAEFRRLLRTASMGSHQPSPSGVRNPQKF